MTPLSQNIFDTSRHLAFVACFVGIVVGTLPAKESSATERLAQRGETSDAAKSARGPGRWEAAIKRFEKIDQMTPPPKGAVLLVGGSNARRWSDVDVSFPNHHVINRGFGGARMTDILHFADRIILPYAPSTILVNAGGNDLGSGKSQEEIRDTARALIEKVRRSLPGTRIYFLGLPLVRRAHGTPDARAAILAMNERLAELAGNEENVDFIDLVPAFLDDHGAFRQEFFVKDGTHFSARGYAVVTGLVRAKL